MVDVTTMTPIKEHAEASTCTSSWRDNSSAKGATSDMTPRLNSGEKPGEPSSKHVSIPAPVLVDASVQVNEWYASGSTSEKGFSSPSISGFVVKHQRSYSDGGLSIQPRSGCHKSHSPVEQPKSCARSETTTILADGETEPLKKADNASKISIQKSQTFHLSSTSRSKKAANFTESSSGNTFHTATSSMKTFGATSKGGKSFTSSDYFTPPSSVATTFQLKEGESVKSSEKVYFTPASSMKTSSSPKVGKSVKSSENKNSYSTATSSQLEVGESVYFSSPSSMKTSVATSSQPKSNILPTPAAFVVSDFKSSGVTSAKPKVDGSVESSEKSYLTPGSSVVSELKDSDTSSRTKIGKSFSHLGSHFTSTVEMEKRAGKGKCTCQQQVKALQVKVRMLRKQVCL